MARGDSTIRVNIIGDAKSLQGALKTGESAVGGFTGKIKALGAGIAAAFVADAVIDFARTALNEADRVGDAIGGLERQLGGQLAKELDDRADDFSHLGASRQDILEMERAFADTATALGQGKDDIAAWSEDAAAIAAAFALGKDTDTDTVIKQIGLAASGSKRPLRELGISLDDAEVEARALADAGKKTADTLTDQELTAARYKIILEKLAPVLEDATEGSGDFEQKSGQLQAKWETLTGRIGEGLEGPLTELLDWILRGIDGWEMFGEQIGTVEGNLRSALTPIADVAAAVGGLIDQLSRALGLTDDLNGASASVPRLSGPGLSDSKFDPDRGRNVNVTIQGGNPGDVEASVRKAINGYTQKNGKWFPLD